jgi:dipeptidyl aminopeptidase/acylaminoacyl peptidase
MEQQIIIHTDSQQLSSVLHIPPGNEHEKKPAIVICHGFISSKVGQHRMFISLARQLCQVGFVVLRFDFSGCGESSGEYRDVTITQQIEETKQVIDFVAEHPNVDTANITLLGHSMGGAIAASVAAIDTRIQQLILLSPVAEPLHDILGILGQERYQQCLQEGIVNYEGFEIGKDLFCSLSQVDPLAGIHKFKGNVLLIHGSEDVETPLQNAYQYQVVLERRLKSHCELRIIAGADHTYNSPLWERELQQIIIQWLA